jgi:hypothetical protein
LLEAVGRHPKMMPNLNPERAIRSFYVHHL